MVEIVVQGMGKMRPGSHPECDFALLSSFAVSRQCEYDSKRHIKVKFDIPAMKMPKVFVRALALTPSPDEVVSDFVCFPLAFFLSGSEGFRPEARTTVLQQAEERWE